MLVNARYVKVKNYAACYYDDMKSAIAVIDIGMTNKKIVIYDENLVQTDVVYKEFAPVMIHDPHTGSEIPVHDLSGMETWFIGQLRNFAAQYPIRAISVTTHGATFVCLDRDGRVCEPCIFYTYDPGERFQTDFYKLCGTREDLQKQTFTPAFSSLINMAKGIQFLQIAFAAGFKKTSVILGFPQYWGFRLTGKAAYEPTYQACHTYLWNQTDSTWSSVVDRLGIRDRLPEKFNPTCGILGTLTAEMAGKLQLPPSVIVTTGIHDSNASLLPYLAHAGKSSDDFILNSTGTWCVCMHPQEQAEFKDDDIGKVVFFNRSAVNKPVKTSVFLGGMEVDTYVKFYQRECETDRFPASDADAVRSLLDERNVFIMPEVVRGSGQFPGSEPGIFEDGRFYPLETLRADLKSRSRHGSGIPHILSDRKRFFAALDLSLVIQTVTALRRAGMNNGMKIFTEGGFRRNRLYNSLLASVLPGNEVHLTNMKEATAAGCAMTALMALTGKTYADLAPLIAIEHTQIQKIDVRGFEEYRSLWMTHAQGNL
jgi:sugar (pentulose or hexulose) kinase